MTQQVSDIARNRNKKWSKFLTIYLETNALLAQPCSWEKGSSDTVGGGSQWVSSTQRSGLERVLLCGTEQTSDSPSALVTSFPVAGETWPSYMRLPILPPVFSLICDTEPVPFDFLEQLLLPAGRPTDWRLKVKRVPACELRPTDFQENLEKPWDLLVKKALDEMMCFCPQHSPRVWPICGCLIECVNIESILHDVSSQEMV